MHLTTFLLRPSLLLSELLSGKNGVATRALRYSAHAILVQPAETKVFMSNLNFFLNESITQTLSLKYVISDNNYIRPV